MQFVSQMMNPLPFGKGFGTKIALFFCVFWGFSLKLDLRIPLEFQILQTASLNSEAIRP